MRKLILPLALIVACGPAMADRVCPDGSVTHCGSYACDTQGLPHFMPCMDQNGNLEIPPMTDERNAAGFTQAEVEKMPKIISGTGNVFLGPQELFDADGKRIELPDLFLGTNAGKTTSRAAH